MTKAQQVYEQINTLVDAGATKAEAFKQLTETEGVGIPTLRGAYYQYSKKENGGTTKPRARETTPEGAVESAIATLRRAVEAIDSEIAAAKTRADEAKAEYEAMKASASDRKAAIEAKITALEA